MRIARGGLDLSMAKQFADHGQSLASGEAPGSESMPKVMNANVLQAGKLSDALPRVLKIGEIGVLFFPCDHKRVAGEAWTVSQDGERGIPEMDGFRARLAVGKPQLASVQFYMAHSSF